MGRTGAAVVAVLLGVGLCGDDTSAQDPTAANPRVRRRVKVDVLFPGDLPSLEARHQDEFKLGVQIGLSWKSSGHIAVADMEVTLTASIDPAINAEVLFHENVTIGTVQGARDEIVSTELNITVDGETYTASSVSAPVVTEENIPGSSGSEGGDGIDTEALVLAALVVGTLLAILLGVLGKRACLRELKRRTAKVDITEQAARRFSEGPGGKRRFSGNARQMDASLSGDAKQIRASFSGSSLGRASPDTNWRTGLLYSSQLADGGVGIRHLGPGDGSPLGRAARTSSSQNAAPSQLPPIDASQLPEAGLNGVDKVAALAASPLPLPDRSAGPPTAELPPLPTSAVPDWPSGAAPLLPSGLSHPSTDGDFAASKG